MADQPVEVAYFYRTKWGHHEEFLELFTRNHLPVLREQVEIGRLLDVSVQAPRFHGDGRADWDVLVTIVFRDWAAMEAHSDQVIIERLFPDQTRYRDEERRRFTILDAHWDVPLDLIVDEWGTARQLAGPTEGIATAPLATSVPDNPLRVGRPVRPRPTIHPSCRACL